MEAECASLLSSFFAKLRERRKMMKKAKNDENPQKTDEKFEK
jgi:hypothetical protein